MDVVTITKEIEGYIPGDVSMTVYFWKGGHSLK